MDVKVCPDCDYQNLPVAIACKECGRNITSIEVTKIKNEDRLLTSVIIGGVSGIVGGLLRTILFHGRLDIGTYVLCVFYPLLAPVGGIIAAIIIHILWVQFDKKVKRSVIYTIIFLIGFLAGFLPFRYYLVQ